MAFKFIAGLLIGATVVHYLNTEEGKALISRIKKDTEKIQGEMETLADELVQSGKSFINTVLGETDQPGA